MRRFLLLALSLATASCAQTPHRTVASPALDRCRELRHHGKQPEMQSCFAGLVRSNDAFLQAEGYWGLGRFEEANTAFRAAYKGHPNSPEIAVEWGNFFLERYNPGDAEGLFEEAVKAKDAYAPAYLGLSRVAALGYNKKAPDLAHHAIALDPKFVEAHEFLAFLALEDGDQTVANREAQSALALSGEALAAMSVLASIDWLNGKQQSEWSNRALKVNPMYGEAYETGAHFLVINHRYDEGIRLYREALTLNPNLQAARSELGLNLMRLGMDEEAREQLQLAFQSGYRNAETTNALRFLDSLKDFQTFRSEHAALILNKKEAALLQPYVQSELERAIAAYETKYKMKLPGPVRVEVFPNHDDFVVRTLGLPGQGGLLGVTFGLVVAMDSPSAREPGQFRWASTLRHEMSHVYVLSATHNLVPRWFTEGLAVHEEGAAEPDWGDRLTPEVVDALEKKRLLPVVELEHGFVRPEYPAQVIVSYYQAGKICDFIVQKWGDQAILGIIQAFAHRKTTTEAIEENLRESPAAFDKEFSTWLGQQTQNTVQHFDEWKKRMQAAGQPAKDEGGAREETEMRDFYPDYVGAHSAYEVLADLYLARGDKAQATQQLESYRNRGGSDVSKLKILAGLEEEAGRARDAEDTLNKVNFIYVEDEEVHRKLGTLRLKRGDSEGAVREYQAVLALKPADAAQAHFDLATALQSAHRASEAKDEVLLALEAAPGFKPAQRLLLQLSQ